MAETLSYADAVKILGGTDSRIVAALDRLTGGLLLAASGGGAAFALSMFDAKGELARLSGELVTGLSDRLRGLSRFDRTERLAAAHRVIVLTAFFDEVRRAPLPFDRDELRFERASQVALATGREPSSARLTVLVQALSDSDVPVSAFPDGRDMAHVLLDRYRSLGDDLLRFVAERPVWQRLTEAERAELAETMRERIPATALRRYEELFHRLATEFPEVAFWSNRMDHRAIGTEIGRLSIGLQGLGRALDRLAGDVAPDERRQTLARRYRRLLDRPVVATGDAPDGLVIPSLADAYVNPGFRAAPVSPSDRLDREEWWETHPVRDDLQEFLVGYLTAMAATAYPLIVLGQPGSGKSLLTKVLAARLPPSDFLVVRVVLREVPADADLQSQIEFAIRDTTGEALTWPALSRAAGAALPVVILDGFDELLQATGVGQTDYLAQVVRFQEREADLGRPVSFIVTSRTAVADRVKLPEGGAVAARLEPFNARQVTQWLGIWEAANAAPLARRGLRPLPAGVVMRHPELAAQPLLLLMLALYDANANALQNRHAGLDKTDLYDRILVSFAEREIRKSVPGLAAGRLDAAVEAELLRLSIAAFAMFNRGRQWATEEELNADLTALLGRAAPLGTGGFAAPSTPAQEVVGRFFFIHQAQAVRGGTRLTTCEFLHATFGEFLVARLICRELADLVTVAEAATVRSRPSPDDGFLRALLSFAPLTTRAQIVEFLANLCRRFEPRRAALLRRLLLTAFRTAMEPATDSSRSDYAPMPQNVPARHAAYSANTLLLIAIVGGPVRGRELFPKAPFPVAEWRRHALLWKSQLPGEGWRGLAAALRLDRVWWEGERDVTVGLSPWDPPPLDPFWIFKYPHGDPHRRYQGWRYPDTNDLRRESHFTCDLAEDIVWHGLEPLTDAMRIHDPPRDEATTGFGVLSEEVAMSATHALIRLWITSGRHGDPEELARAYRDGVQVIHGSRGPSEATSRNALFVLLLRQLAADAHRLPEDLLKQLFDLFRNTVLDPRFVDAHPEVAGWARQAFGDRYR